ncbi:hypothetical protein DXG03_004451 [Asterophora parasitica]|uniref:Uncharacterized protein n=1 Tax=Asterophora parasitica TaxID=117018 RepID=A0A9P7FYZ0_9AGAR|nr:hypothetical protein DXG03_004451 [Asterophora parasitica]
MLHLVSCGERGVRDQYLSHPLFPAMKTLVLEQSTIPPYMIEHLARIFPAIKHLTVIGFHKSVLGMLSCTQRWPNDMVLSLWAWKDEIVNIAAIQRMLKRRIESGRPIAKLCIVNKPPMFPNFFLRNYVQLEIMEEPMIWPRWSPVDQ